MTDFLEALFDPDAAFIRHALAAGLIASFTFGIVGSYVVARRISYIAAAIAHSVLGGIGAAIYFQRTQDLPWLTPTIGALAAALLSALIIGSVSLAAKEREDTVIGTIWAGGMAVGLLFIHYTPGPAVNLESYIFGNILFTTRSDLIVMACLGFGVVLLSLLFYNKLLAVCFDDEFARLRGVNATFYYLLLLCLVGICVVLLVQLTGIILAIALIVLPAATAGRLTNRLSKIMGIAIILSMICTTSGLALSYSTETPTGPVIVLIVAALYLVSLLFTIRRRKKIKASAEPV